MISDNVVGVDHPDRVRFQTLISPGSHALRPQKMTAMIAKDPPNNVVTERAENWHPEAASSVSTDGLSDRMWQERLLPLMIWMVVGLTVFFFVATLMQLVYLNVSIQREPNIDARVVELLLDESPVDAVSHEFRILALLDANTLERRYHQNNVQLMSRVWARYLGFVTGMILALVGAIFVLGKLREDTTEIQAGTRGTMLNLKSASPGLIMAVLGVALMVTTIVTHHSMQWADSSVYLRMAYPKPEAAIFEEPPVDFP